MTDALASLRLEANWAGASVVYRTEPETREEQAMGDHTIAVAFRPIARIGWRRGSRPTELARLSPGEGFILTGEPFVWASTSHGYDGLMLGLPDDFLCRVTAGEVVISARDLRPAQFVRDRVLAHLAGLMRAELVGGGLAGPLYQDSLLTLLAVHLLRTYPDTGVVRTARAPRLSPSRVRQVIDFMRANLAAPIGLADLAAIGCLSPFHFARAFRAATGLPPHRYLTRMRLEHAAVLLRVSALSVAEVARRVGYANVGHFSAQFRRHFGATPAAYRQDRHS